MRYKYGVSKAAVPYFQRPGDVVLPAHRPRVLQRARSGDEVGDKAGNQNKRGEYAQKKFAKHWAVANAVDRCLFVATQRSPHLFVKQGSKTPMVILANRALAQ